MGDAEDTSGRWNIMWLATRFASQFLEISVVVFLFQGFQISGLEALIRTLILSTVIATVDTSIKAMIIFRFSVPLFTPGLDAGDWSKWGFWAFHEGLFCFIYGGILLLRYTRWRERLPAKPSFYRYIAILLCFNISSLCGSTLLGFGAYFGYCIHGFSTYLFSACFPPLLYLSFLADYFTEEDGIEQAYYSELREAGYFDSEWDHSDSASSFSGAPLTTFP